MAKPAPPEYVGLKPRTNYIKYVWIVVGLLIAYWIYKKYYGTKEDR